VYPNAEFWKEAARCPQIAQPSIGLPVLFYRTANPDLEPKAATVIKNHGRGRVDLLVLNDEKPSRRTVAWMRDPELVSLPQHLRGENGAWDFIPGMDFDLRDSRPKDKAAEPKAETAKGKKGE
jgi:hypothetical protein